MSSATFGKDLAAGRPHPPESPAEGTDEARVAVPVAVADAPAADPRPENHLFLNGDRDEVALLETPFGLVAVYSRPSPDKTTSNEDSAAILQAGPRAGLLAVADGVGGYRAGELASRTALESLQDALSGTHEEDAPQLRTAILNGIEDANRRVIGAGLGAATTLAVVEVQDGVIRTYHVGDSMILLVGRRGKLKLQTVSHSPVGFAVESGMLNHADAMHHQDRHLVSNLVGMQEMRIEMGAPLRLARHDTLLLASDGLFDNLHLEEIVERIRKGPLDRAVRLLADEARRRMQHPEAGQPSKPDDLTIVGFRRTR